MPFGEDAYESTIDSAGTALGALNAALTMNVKGIRSFSISVPTGLVGTLTFEGTVDDVNWFAFNLINGAGASVNAIASPGGDIYSAPNHRPALSQVRARVSAYTSGTTTAISRRHPR